MAKNTTESHVPSRVALAVRTESGKDRYVMRGLFGMRSDQARDAIALMGYREGKVTKTRRGGSITEYTRQAFTLTVTETAEVR